MASVNKVILIGNLTRDPELRYTPKGTAVAELGLALNRRYRVENDWAEETTFVDVTVWGSQAETAVKFLSKGRQVYVEGRLRLDTWDDKTSGQKRSKLRVVGETIQFLGGRPESSEGSSSSSYGRGPMRSQPGGERPAAERGAEPEEFPEDPDDDIPF